MSTQQTDIGIEQETLPQAPPPIHAQQMREAEQFAPAHTFPQPPRPPRPKGQYWIVIALAAFLLVIAMSVGMLLLIPPSQHPASQVTPTPSVSTPAATPPPGTIDTTPTPPPGVTPGPQTGPPGVSDPAYWDKILGTQPGTSKVESVSFANIMNTPALQALVTVRYTGTDARLDVYVFNNITSAHPKQIFKLAGLVKGNARISGYSTVMTAEVDKNSSINTGKSLAAMTPDLFREFDWSSEEGTLVQTAFPGLFPDLTRYQAEADQARINQGQDSWKNDPVKVATAFEAQFLAWQRGVRATLLSGGGPHDVSAAVRVQETAVQGAQIKLTLSRLESNTHNFWVVIAAEDDTMLTLTNIDARQLVASPITLEGTGSAFEAEIGQAIVYDHLYKDIGHARVTGTTAGMGPSAYSTKVIYTSSFRQGVQEGIVAVYEKNGGLSDEAFTAVMVKVMLDPEPGVALGPLPCPDAVSSPAYWNQFVSIPPDIEVADQVTCGNLLGKPTLQAMVVAHEIVGGGPLFRSVFVFDNIQAAKPKLLFSVQHLLHGDAQISGYSTIMTAEVDLNSALNKDKADAKLTADLFREFEWSDGASKFVQVAFPGFYPNLTRYQAEQDQGRINQGQDSWKNNPAQVTKALAVQFFGWKRTLSTKVLSGGGPRDVDATVQVQEAPLQHGQGPRPSVIVILSRLEGNTHNMWVAIGVKDATALTLTNLQPRSLVASPVKLEGKGNAFENTIGMAYILDHLYTKVGQVLVTGNTGEGMGNVPYSIQVSYDTSFKTGPQEGIAEVLLNTPIEADPYAAVMVKVLLNPQPRVAQGPVSCPVALQVPGYWETVLGIDTSTSGVGMVSCGNLKGDSSLQALVPVYSTTGKPGEVYVYDHITAAHPVQLFKLQTTSALISGVSTITTQDADLYREFQWSKSDGKFVQVAFPGMYPDLTRGQAEADQASVNSGQDSWKLDAVKTTQHWNLIGGTAKLVKGGGPNDLTAVVKVTYPEPGGPTTNIPVTQVTLSRLEENPNGIWEITSVGSDWLFIYTPRSGTTITSPMTVTGFGPQYEAQVGVVYILDRLYQKIQVGDNYAIVPDGLSPPSRFSLDVQYTSSIKGGAQEGIVELVRTSGASFAHGVVMVKVLISA